LTNNKRGKKKLVVHQKKQKNKTNRSCPNLTLSAAGGMKTTGSV